MSAVSIPWIRTAFGSVMMLVMAMLMGCGSAAPQVKSELPPPIVTVAAPVERMVTRYEYFTGRTEPLDKVEIRARVSGYLKSIHFIPGKEVTKGTLLFEIDPEPFKADLERAKANVLIAEADLLTAEADLVRADSRQFTTKKTYDREEDAFKRGVGSEANRDIAKGMYDEAAANVKSGNAKIKQGMGKVDEAKANVRNAELNLGYCTIKAPIDGIIGDKLVTEGNLVTGGVGNTTLLTTIVAVEKMDVAFDVDENTLQRVEGWMRDGKIKMLIPGEIPVEAGLAVHGDTYPIKGVVNFADNQVDPKTGTIRMKARFDNPKPKLGNRLFSAGMYARVRVPIGEPVKSMLVPEAAFASDQGTRILYLVSSDNKAIRVNAAIGISEGELRVVESIQLPGESQSRSLMPQDRVIVNGLMRVRPGITVEPKFAK